MRLFWNYCRTSENTFSRHFGEYGRLSKIPNTYEKDRSPPRAPVLSPLNFRAIGSSLLSSRGGGLNDPRSSDCGLRSSLLPLLLLPVLAGKVLRPGHDDHYDRSHAPPYGKQPGHSYQVRSSEHFTEEPGIGVEGGVQHHGQ